MVLLGFLVRLLTLIANITLSNILFNKKRNLVVNLVTWFCSTLIILLAAKSVTQIFKPNMLLTFLLSYLFTSTYIFACCYLYENNLTQIVFTFFTLWIISSMFSSICLHVSTLYFSYLTFQYQAIVRIILFALIYSAIIPIIKYKLLNNIKKVFDMLNSKFRILILFPVFSFILFNVIFSPYDNNVTSYKLLSMVMYIFIIIFAYYLVFSFFDQIYEKSRIEERLIASQHHQSLQKEYYAVLKKSIDEINMILHDSKHHLITIRNLLKTKNIDELDKYLNNLILKEENIDFPVVCENSAVNAVISYYVNLSKSLNINTDFKISIPDNIKIESLDLNIILGNSLDNAIEACCKLTDESKRFININASIIKHYFVLKIDNSFDGIVNVQHDHYNSTKSNTQNHGIGLESIRTIVNKYRGLMNLSYTENEFTTSIMLYNE